jgi:antitoxin component YwqK of YwqJK toxin-antitoxin module
MNKLLLLSLIICASLNLNAQRKLRKQENQMRALFTDKARYSHELHSAILPYYAFFYRDEIYQNRLKEAKFDVKRLEDLTYAGFEQVNDNEFIVYFFVKLTYTNHKNDYFLDNDINQFDWLHAPFSSGIGKKEVLGFFNNRYVIMNNEVEGQLDILFSIKYQRIKRRKKGKFGKYDFVLNNQDMIVEGGVFSGPKRQFEIVKDLRILSETNTGKFKDSDENAKYSFVTYNYTKRYNSSIDFPALFNHDNSKNENLWDFVLDGKLSFVSSRGDTLLSANYDMGIPMGVVYERHKQTNLLLMQMQYFNRGDSIFAIRSEEKNGKIIETNYLVEFQELNTFNNNPIGYYRHGYTSTRSRSGVMESKFYYRFSNIVCPCFEYFENGALKSEYSQAIHEFDSYDNEEIHLIGNYKLYNKDGGLIETGVLDSQRKKQGDVLIYRNDGSLESKVNHTKGLRNGILYSYYKDGKLKSTIEYKNGQLIKQIDAFDNKGKQTLFNGEGTYYVYFDDEKSIDFIGRYKNGVREGLCEWFYSNGSRYLAIEHQNGERWSIVESNNKWGKSYGTLKNGNGYYYRYNDNGGLRDVFLYKNGKIAYEDKLDAQGKSTYFEKEKNTILQEIQSQYGCYFQNSIVAQDAAKTVVTIDWRKPRRDLLYTDKSKAIVINGNLVSFYYPNGNLFGKGQFNPDPVGEWVIYHPDGSIKSNVFFNEKSEIIKEYYYLDNQIIFQREKNLSGGERIKAYYLDNRQLLFDQNYDGNVDIYWENGRKHLTIEARNNQFKTGAIYDKQGKLEFYSSF